MWRLYRYVHPAWMIALGCLFFSSGVYLSGSFRVDLWVGVACLVLSVVCFYKRTVVAMCVFGALCFGVGLGVGNAHQNARDEYATLFGDTIVLRGRLAEDMSATHSGAASLQIDEVFFGERSLPGTILVTTRAPTAVRRGDSITVRGRLVDGFGSYPATMRLAEVQRVVSGDRHDLGRVVRDWFADKVRSLIPEPQASLGVGFLTGQKSALSDDLSEALKIVGLTHIVVASGYNLTVLVRLARRLLLRFSKFLAMVSACAMVVGFVAVAGLSPSMSRAGLVSGMSLFAWYYGHAFHPFVLLPLAAALTIAYKPSYAWGDLGWQLSFGAFAAVMIVSPLLQAYLFAGREPGVLARLLIETVAAHLVTLPIIAINFGTVSHVAIVANVLVVPFVPLAMLLTFICGVWSSLGVGFSALVATPTTWLLGYMVNVAEFIARAPWAQTELSVPGWGWAMYGGALVLVCVWMWRVTKYRFRDGVIAVV